MNGGEEDFSPLDVVSLIGLVTPILELIRIPRHARYDEKNDIRRARR